MTNLKKIEEDRKLLIAKSNQMIRKSRYTLTVVEQKIILFLFSKIKPDDTEFVEYTFEIKYFCEVCGIDYSNGGNYKYIKSVIKNLADKSFWIEENNSVETLCRWIQKVSIDKDTGMAIMQLDKTILNHAIELIKSGNFTKYMMIYTLPMKGQYSRPLYELLKSRESELNKYNKESVIYKVIDLQCLLMSNYKKYNDFKRKVIDYAIEEINEYSDLQITYEEIPLKTGKRGKPPIGSLKFFIKSRDVFDINITRQVNNDIMNKQAKIKE